MNPGLMDPKLIVLAVAIVIIAVLAWLYVRKRRSQGASRSIAGSAREKRCVERAPVGGGGRRGARAD